MSLLVIVVASAIILSIAYLTYGPILVRLLQLRDDRPTPAVEMRDDVDYVPIEPKFLMSQHFSAIAAAGPIVGPILAGVMFGWLPALIWIIVGSIFIGGVHDMTSLVASIRHKARSIAEVVRDHMSRRAYVVFLAFIWLSLVYIIVAFTDITASSFIGVQPLEDGSSITGGGVATSSLLYLALPIIMGLLLRYTKLSVDMATLIFLPLVGLSIWGGQLMPFDLEKLFGIAPENVHTAWNIALLLYCLIASVIPMWLLLQPRGHLGGYFLYIALGGGMIGLMIGGNQIRYPAFTGWVTEKGDPLFPLLFVTIACGACSGFHSIIASGTTSKQLRKETDAKVIGYGSMLLEAMVAIVSLCCVMMLPIDHKDLVGGAKPNFLYAKGIGNFLHVLGVPVAFGVSFGLMAFTTFVYDTLDVCTRLGRYILQELTGMQNAFGRWFATLLTAGAPLAFLIWKPTDASGKPVWQIFWNLFGASNQLLAALTLLGVTVWIWKTRRVAWIWFVTGIPTVWMYIVSMTALSRLIVNGMKGGIANANAVPWVAILLFSMGFMILVEAILILWRPAPSTPSGPALAPA